MLPYRIQQVRWAVSARPLSAQIKDRLREILLPAELALFERFSVSDQNHSWRVFIDLQRKGHAHPSLFKAALLHDVGKTRTSLTVADRSVAVLGEMLIPQQTDRWGRIPLNNSPRFYRPFVVRDQHAAWGAEMALEAGSDPLTVELIRRHQDEIESAHTEADQLLMALQASDNIS